MKQTLLMAILITLLLKSVSGVARENIEFVPIYGGSFMMGSPENAPDRNDNEKQRFVTITYNYEIMSTEVTQMQWFMVMKNNPSQFKGASDCDNHISISGQELCPNNPVESVSWNDIREFINKLNQTAHSCIYRLPTEAEWEYAARGGTTSAYSFGDTLFRAKDYSWYSNNSNTETHPVGLKKSNPYGLYDVHGNVWEWVEDTYTTSPLGGNDPTGPASGFARVLRGGSWSSLLQYLRSANRSHGNPSFSSNSVGFRLVRTL